MIRHRPITDDEERLWEADAEFCKSMPGERGKLSRRILRLIDERNWLLVELRHSMLFQHEATERLREELQDLPVPPTEVTSGTA